MSQEQQEQVLQNSEPQSVDVTVNVGGDSRAERFLGTFDQISRLSLDIDRNYGNKRVLTDFPLEHDGSKWTGTINKLIVGFDYTITGHAYNCTSCSEELGINVSTIAGSQNGNPGDGANKGSQNGSSFDAKFNNPWDVAVDKSGNIYIVERQGLTIRKISSNKVVSTLAGGSEGSDDGIGSEAQFRSPAAITLDANGNIFNGGSAGARPIYIQYYACGDCPTNKWIGSIPDFNGSVFKLDPAGLPDREGTDTKTVCICCPENDNIWFSNYRYRSKRFINKLWTLQISNKEVNGEPHLSRNNY